MVQKQVETLLADPATRPQALDWIGEWAKDNVLLQGGRPSTAYVVAWLLVEGIAAAREQRKANYWICR